LILFETWSSTHPGSQWLWLAGLVGALLTALYIFRLVFVAFFGPAQKQVEQRPGLSIRLPLIVLAILSVVGGFVQLPQTLGGLSLFSNFMQTTLPVAEATHPALSTELLLQLIASVVSLAGVYLAYLFYRRRPAYVERLIAIPLGARVQRLWFSGWGFDALYSKIFIHPYLWLAQINRADIIDSLPTALAQLNQGCHALLSRTQAGVMRWYAMGLALGAALFVAIVVLI